MRVPRIDLHAHSSASDGTATPTELVERAHRAGLDVVAITDHDTVSGWAEAIGAAQRLGIGLVPGIEVSTTWYGRSVHMLAYLPDPANEALAAELQRTRAGRESRAREIVTRISADYPLDWDAVEQLALGRTVGRPHIADALVEQGLATDRYDAFDRILHPRHGYTVPVPAPSPVDAVQLIRAAGGVPVLAHPGTVSPERVVPRERLEQFVDAGLFGLEAHHPENHPEAVPLLVQLAVDFGIDIVGGSDWHGSGKSNELADGLTAPDVLERLLDEATGSQPVNLG